MGSRSSSKSNNDTAVTMAAAAATTKAANPNRQQPTCNQIQTTTAVVANKNSVASTVGEFGGSSSSSQSQAISSVAFSAQYRGSSVRIYSGSGSGSGSGSSGSGSGSRGNGSTTPVLPFADEESEERAENCKNIGRSGSRNGERLVVNISNNCMPIRPRTVSSLLELPAQFQAAAPLPLPVPHTVSNTSCFTPCSTHMHPSSLPSSSATILTTALSVPNCIPVPKMRRADRPPCTQLQIKVMPVNGGVLAGDSGDPHRRRRKVIPTR